MKTKISKKTTEKNVQSHNERIKTFCSMYEMSRPEAKKAVNLIDNYLPYGYTRQVRSLVATHKKEVSSQSIRLIKKGAYRNDIVFKCLLQVAAENKKNGVAARKTIKKITKTE